MNQKLLTKKIFSVAVIFSFLWQHNYLQAQATTNNAVNERYIYKPLTLHKNNLEFGLGYQFGTLLSIFNENGNSINMANAGIAASNQLINFQMTYGITERLQVQSLLSYYSYSKTTESVIQKGLGNFISLINGIEKSNSFTDPNLRLNYLLIKNERKLSISLGCGMSFPLEKYKPEMPIIESIYSSNVSKTNFLYKKNEGLGTPSYNLNSAFKLRLGESHGSGILSKIIVRLYTNYYTTTSAVSTNDWQYVFDAGNPNGYTYQTLPLKHKEGDWLSNKLFIDWQAFNITSFLFGVHSRHYFHGWNQTDYMKIAENDVSETNLLFGTHIQATPRLRIDEIFTLPVSGKNIESYFNCQISLVYYLMK